MKYICAALVLCVGFAYAMEPDAVGKGRSSSVPSPDQERTDRPTRTRSSSLRIDLTKARQAPMSSPPAVRSQSPKTQERLEQVIGSPRERLQAGQKAVIKQRISSPRLESPSGQ